MRRILLLITLQVGLLYNSNAQESRDYFSLQEQFNHAQNLYKNQLYPAAYDLFTELIRSQEKQNLFPSEQLINAKLYRALSATLSDQQIGIPLVLQFMDEYPDHPNQSVAHLELGKYYANNRQFNQSIQQFDLVNTATLTDAQRLDFQMNAGYTNFIKKRFRKAENYLQSAANRPSESQQDAIYYLGLSQYFQGDYDNALNNLQRVKSHPKYGSEIPYYFARILFEQKKYDEVIAYQGKSKNPEFNQIIGQSYFNLERYRDALPYLEKFSATAVKQSPEALYQLAYTQYQMGQYQKAIQNFEQLNIIDDEVGQYALYALAESYLKVNDKEKALQAFSRAAKLDYNDTIKENATFSEAKLSYELGRNNDAIALMQAFVEQYPRSANRNEADEYLVDLFLNSTNYVDALAILEKMNNRSPKMNEAYQKVAYFRAVELYQTGDLSESKALLDKVIANNQDARYTALANYWLGEMAYEYGRYPLALSYLTKFMDAPINKPSQYLSQANYTAGYAYYRQKKYQQAADSFGKVAASSPLKNDASLRKADSYFVMKNYASASQAYQSVQNANDRERDYAKYQIAILQGLQGNTVLKGQQLQQLYTTSPTSAYADDALFEHGRMALTQENYRQAEQRFSQLLNQYPNSEKSKETYNQLGLLHFNQGNYEEALKNYDQVVRNFANTDEAASALQAIQEIYIEQGNPDGYFAYLNTVDGVTVDQNEQERIVYAAAETQFKNANCTQAISGFTNYLNSYPRGFYSANAHFYRGECLNQNGEQKQAVEDFKAVIKLPPNKFSERSLIRVARFEYRTRNYAEAIAAFKKIEQLSSNTQSIYEQEVQIGLMQAYNRLPERTLAYQYADKVINQQQIDASITNEAEFLLAMQRYTTGDESNAYLALDRVAVKMRDQWGAEARYIMAKILHNQKQYARSTQAAYRVADETPAEDDWVARSFILVARNYKGQGELFQAKATVESVIENYKGSDQSIIIEAKELLSTIKRIELEKSNLFDQKNDDNQLQLKDN